jgi:hypothetical protein
LTFTDCSKRVAEIALRRRPIERQAVAREFFERLPVRRDGFLQALRSRLSFAERQKRAA